MSEPIKTKKEAKACGASWVVVKVTHANGATFTLEGAFSPKDANEIVVEANARPPVEAK